MTADQINKTNNESVSAPEETSSKSSKNPEKNSSHRSGSKCSVFVGNLSYETTGESLKEHMLEAGDVIKASILTDADENSKGCGIVVFDDEFTAARAIKSLNQTFLDGRKIHIKLDSKTNFHQKGVLQAALNTNVRPSSRSTASQAIRRQASAGCKLYVGKIPWSYKWKQLEDICSPFGEVLRADVEFNGIGRSKGFGTVVFKNETDAQECILGLNESECEGRKLHVRLDTKPGVSNAQPGFKVYVGNLPWNSSWQTLKDLGSEFGEVQFSDIPRQPSGRSRGFGLITFETEESAKNCIENLNGREFNGRSLFVREDNYK